MLFLVFLTLSINIAAQLVVQPQRRENTNKTSRAIPVDITYLFNNRGFGGAVGDADFDGYNSRSLSLERQR